MTISPTRTLIFSGTHIFKNVPRRFQVANF
jgi:hypothetical protein